MVTPIIKPSEEKEEENDEEQLQAWEATKYKAGTARAIYLSQDRWGIQYAAKELSRAMGSPTRRDWKALRRLARYLIGKERVINKFKWQKANIEEGRDRQEIQPWVDTDYAGLQEDKEIKQWGIN